MVIPPCHHLFTHSPEAWVTVLVTGHALLVGAVLFITGLTALHPLRQQAEDLGLAVEITVPVMFKPRPTPSWAVARSLLSVAQGYGRPIQLPRVPRGLVIFGSPEACDMGCSASTLWMATVQAVLVSESGL